MNGRFSLLASICALVVGLPTGRAQDGAPLITGLGGPFDVGLPHEDHRETLQVAPAFPDGITFYTGQAYRDVYLNWGGSLSFFLPDTWSYSEIPEIRGSNPPGPRIVAFGHASDLAEFGRPGEQSTPAFYANLPAAEGEPGRFIATWYRVTNNEDVPGIFPVAYNTWQAVLTAGPDPGNYEIELRYNQCQWTYPLGDVDYPAAMGFDGGRGAFGNGWEWSGSRSEDMLKLCQLSNVREPGVFRYRVVDGVPTGCGIDAEPPPGEDRCTDGNHLPGDGCSPACYVEPDVDGDGQTEAPHPDSVDPDGVYDRCSDPEDEACDDDNDGDGIPPHLDNCDDDYNPDQRDYDDDRFGDACELDPDDDTLPDEAIPDLPNRPADICPRIWSRGDRQIVPGPPPAVQQPDIDGDGVGDACDPDDDGDGVLDCGGDGICPPDDDGYDNDRDGLIDEGAECVAGSNCHHGGRDFFDNDDDGAVDEATERDFPFVEWPGRDLPPAEPEDNCRRIPNPDQLDLDGDGIGDACDPDIDGDGIPNCAGNGICGPANDGRDNDADGSIDEEGECADGCPDPAADFIDQDLDGWVDEAHESEQAMADGATLPDPVDNCPRVASANTDDFDGDGVGDVCDDSDGDEFFDAFDNCPGVSNADQDDLDEDGIGDPCDDDRDGDGVLDARDRCPDDFDEGVDTDDDGVDDVCDPDDDDDQVNDRFDRCPKHFDPDQADLDEDGLGDACDPDDDGDGVADEDDRCPRLADDQRDTDGDGVGDACDADDDGDGVSDGDDLCPLVADPEQGDLDGDGLGDACDPEDDRPFDARSPEERCALLIEAGAPTAERLRHCPPPAEDGCSALPGRAPAGAGWLWLLLGCVPLGRRRRPRR